MHKIDANCNGRTIVVEAGDPVLGIAYRGVAYGELEILVARYNPVVSLTLLEL